MVVSFFFILSSFSSFALEKHYFVPENDLYISESRKVEGKGISREQFESVINKVENIYSSIVASKNGRLVIQRNWTDGTVNAVATQDGPIWEVQMFGGLARHEAITVDGMALVVCHEIGHHLGGAPRKRGSKWASNEGQSDYFSTAKCLRKVFIADNNKQIVAALVPPTSLIGTCKTSKSSEEDQLICIRSGMAGMSVAKLFQSLGNEFTPPSFDKVDSSEVLETVDRHPKTQCRLDTYMAGALCSADARIDLDTIDESIGACHAFNGDESGLRPSCWFKSKL